MLGKVRHVQNLAAKNMSSALKSTQGIEFLKYSGMPLHAATSLLSHIGRRGGTTPKKKKKLLELAGPVSILALVQGDVEQFETAQNSPVVLWVPVCAPRELMSRFYNCLCCYIYASMKDCVALWMFYPTSTSAFCRLPSIVYFGMLGRECKYW